MNAIRRAATALAALFVLGPFGALVAQTPGAGRAVITVTAIGRKDSAPPPVSKSDVQLVVSKENKQIAGWDKANGLALAILIDDSLESTAANQWNDLRDFIMAQNPNTAVAVAYAADSTIRLAQDFTTDHALAAKALRIPLGQIALGSPYLSVLDWLKRWPETGTPRSLLLISSGIDYFRTGWAPFYPDLDSVIDRAQRGNINLWSIYYPTVGHRSRSFGLVNLGVNNLTKMTDETGGETYFLGVGAPVTIKPYLDEILMHLNNQYLLTFAGDGGSKGKYTRIQLKTELQGVELTHSNNAFIQPSK